MSYVEREVYNANLMACDLWDDRNSTFEKLRIVLQTESRKVKKDLEDFYKEEQPHEDNLEDKCAQLKETFIDNTEKQFPDKPGFLKLPENKIIFLEFYKNIESYFSRLKNAKKLEDRNRTFEKLRNVLQTESRKAKKDLEDFYKEELNEDNLEDKCAQLKREFVVNTQKEFSDTPGFLKVPENQIIFQEFYKNILSYFSRLKKAKKLEERRERCANNQRTFEKLQNVLNTESRKVKHGLEKFYSEKQPHEDNLQDKFAQLEKTFMDNIKKEFHYMPGILELPENKSIVLKFHINILSYRSRLETNKELERLETTNKELERLETNKELERLETFKKLHNVLNRESRKVKHGLEKFYSEKQHHEDNLQDKFAQLEKTFMDNTKKEFHNMPGILELPENKSIVLKFHLDILSYRLRLETAKKEQGAFKELKNVLQTERRKVKDGLEKFYREDNYKKEKAFMWFRRHEDNLQDKFAQLQKSFMDNTKKEFHYMPGFLELPKNKKIVQESITNIQWYYRDHQKRYRRERYSDEIKQLKSAKQPNKNFFSRIVMND